MKINSLTINGIGGIKHLDLKFNDKLNVICGANGIGKSTILNIIADAFNAGYNSKLKRNALCNNGDYLIDIYINKECPSKKIQVSIKYFDPEKSDAFYKDLPIEDFLFFNINRNVTLIIINLIQFLETLIDTMDLYLLCQ